MTYATSRQSYSEALESGLISKRQVQVLDYMQNCNGPVSQGACGRHMEDASSSFQPRFRELEDSGLIRCIGVAKDPVTHRSVRMYTLTNKEITEKVKPARRKREIMCPCCSHTFSIAAK